MASEQELRFQNLTQILVDEMNISKGESIVLRHIAFNNDAPGAPILMLNSEGNWITDGYPLPDNTLATVLREYAGIMDDEFRKLQFSRLSKSTNHDDDDETTYITTHQSALLGGIIACMEQLASE